MVDLPHLKTTGEEKVGVVHSTPPTSLISSGDIKAPYEAFANAMDSWGDAIKGLGKSFGRQAKGANKQEPTERRPRRHSTEEDSGGGGDGGDGTDPEAYGYFGGKPQTQADAGNPDQRAIMDDTYRQFSAAGLSQIGVAGIMGNVGPESGWNPKSRHSDQPNWTGEANYAHGLYQEGGQEWNNYAAWLKKNHPDAKWDSHKLQTEFLVENLQKNYPKVWKQLHDAKTADEAANIFMRGYLKPADWAMQSSYGARAAEARRHHQYYSRQSGLSAPDGAADDAPTADDKMPDDHAYSRVVQLRSLIDAETTADQGIAGIRKQYAGDPEAFLAASAEYKDNIVNNVAKTGATPVAEGLSHAVDHNVDQHFTEMLRDKHASDVSAGQQAVSGKLDELATRMQGLALAGGVEDSKFKVAQADYRAMLNEASGNHLFGFNAGAIDGHLEATVAKTKEAALIGGARRAFAAGGEDAAREWTANNIPHFGHDDEGEEKLFDKVSRDIDLQAAKVQADKRKIEDFHRETIKAHTEQGFAKLATASLDQGWLDQNSHYIEPAALNSLQTAMYARDPEVSGPAAHSDLTATAISNPEILPSMAADALAAGDLSRNDFGALVDLSNQVKEDAKARPWLNALRRDLTHWSDAVGEFGEYVEAHPQATRAELRAASTEISRQYAERDHSKAVAALPLPRFAPFAKSDFTPDKMPEVAERLRLSHQGGKLTDREFLAQVDLLRKWRDLLQRAPEKVA